MITYTLTWFGMIFLRLISDKNSQNFLYILLLIFLTSFSGLRWEVGCDWGNYLRHFLIVSDPSFSPLKMRTEQGWWILIDLVEKTGFQYFTINLLVAILFFAAMHMFMKRQNDPSAFLIILFPMLILGIVMAAIRQAIAIGFVSIAFLAFIDRSPLRMTMLLLISSLFHTSSLIFLTLIPLSWGNLTKVKIFIGIIISFPILFVIFNFESAKNAREIYINSDIISHGVFIRIGSLLSTVFLFCVFLRKSWQRNSSNDYPLAIIFVIGTLLLSAIAVPASVIADRLSYYFIPLQAMIVVRAQILPGVRNRQFLLALQWLVFSIALLGWMSVSELFVLCYVPYTNVIFWVPN